LIHGTKHRKKKKDEIMGGKVSSGIDYGAPSSPDNFERIETIFFLSSTSGWDRSDLMKC
jgi:hypothetical protein